MNRRDLGIIDTIVTTMTDSVFTSQPTLMRASIASFSLRRVAYSLITRTTFDLPQPKPMTALT